MSKTEPEAHLTPQQKTVIELTVSAVTEMLNNIMSISPKKRAIILRKPHRQSTKSTVWTAMLFSIVDGNQELPARRESIRKRLPGELAEIDKSDASDILQSLVGLYFLEHKKKILRGRGRPSPYGYKDDKDDNRGGKPSYYDTSTELKESIEVLKNQIVLTLINNRLIETGVLPKFLKYQNLVLYYLVRMDGNKYWQTLKPFPFVEKARTDRRKSIDLYLDKIRSLSENELQEQAEKSAQYTLRRNSENINFFINIIGGALALRPS